MPRDPELVAHQEWLGYLQPVGLVVSAPALKAAQAVPDRNIATKQDLFDGRWVAAAHLADAGTAPAVTDLPGLLRDPDLFGWEVGDLLGAPGADPVPDSLEVHLEAFEETLRPTCAVPVFTKDPAAPRTFQMLIVAEPPGTDLDTPGALDARRWQASPQARMERLLRETGVPTGLLSNGTHLRLIYAPRGENSGYLSFPVKAMTEVAGRPIFAALLMLLEAPRLFSMPERQRLPAILAESRRMQGQVSTALAGQVLEALYELLRGFQAADDHLNGALLRETLAAHPDHVYEGLLTVLLRVVTLLYAEDRGLISTDPVYVNHYSVHGLFERLREDAGHWPDTMDQRYGAWAQLVVLFRLMHDGGGHAGLHIPARRGRLFDPDRFPFLEGRTTTSLRGGEADAAISVIPPVPDGTIFRVLEKLLVLDGETLSYRSLDVEQIGSVYTGVMGFTLRTATGPSIAVKSKKARRDAAPVTVDLDALLAVKGEQRAAKLRELTDQEVTGEALKALKAAKTRDDIVAALDRKVARAVTPAIIPAGSMVLQPTDERRRSGSHYTPRALTEPIVREALRPILARLGPKPRPEEILSLKICDLAVGSGAFLVEAGRQLGDALVDAWHANNALPAIPPDEDEHLHARRLVAQRCLYGVDRNQLAVDLAKLSLWLATLAKDHPFTFLDHNLRCGDSLVGLSREQIASFTWETGTQQRAIRAYLDEHLREAEKSRAAILAAGEEVRERELLQLHAKAEQALADVRLVGDLVISAFFSEEKPKARAEKLQRLGAQVMGRLMDKKGLADLREAAEALRSGEHPVVPFHWEIEFPEVFDRESPGFDGIIGNPPFLGGARITEELGGRFWDYLPVVFLARKKAADLCTYFLLRGYSLLRAKGTMGFITTKTIAQGDSHEIGLAHLVASGATIYGAIPSRPWPGQALVSVCQLHFYKGQYVGPLALDGHYVGHISTYLGNRSFDAEPSRLNIMKETALQGSCPLGTGFLLSQNEAHELIEAHPKLQAFIAPYLTGMDFNNTPDHFPSRWAINTGELSLDEVKSLPKIYEILLERVYPARVKQDAEKYPRMVEQWWKYWHPRLEVYQMAKRRPRLLVRSRVCDKHIVGFVPNSWIYSDAVVVFDIDSWEGFSIVQSQVHELWMRRYASTMRSDVRYVPTRCWETFPLPQLSSPSATLQELGQVLHNDRDEACTAGKIGYMDLYSAISDPNNQLAVTVRLRELHASMDRAVLDAYGWTDIQPRCEFLLDYEEEDDEAEEGRARRRKKPWRYRWPDDIRDEVLARLLDLNRQRAEQERLHLGEAQLAADNVADEHKPKVKGRSRSSKGSADTGQGGLF